MFFKAEKCWQPWIQWRNLLMCWDFNQQPPVWCEEELCVCRTPAWGSLQQQTPETLEEPDIHVNMDQCLSGILTTPCWTWTINIYCSCIEKMSRTQGVPNKVDGIRPGVKGGLRLRKGEGSWGTSVSLSTRQLFVFCLPLVATGCHWPLSEVTLTPGCHVSLSRTAESPQATRRSHRKQLHSPHTRLLYDCIRVCVLVHACVWGGARGEWGVWPCKLLQLSLWQHFLLFVLLSV